MSLQTISKLNLPLGLVSVSLIALSSQVSALPDVDILNFELDANEVLVETETKLKKPVKLSQISKPTRIRDSRKQAKPITQQELVKADEALKALVPVKINSKPLKAKKVVSTKKVIVESSTTSKAIDATKVIKNAAVLAQPAHNKKLNQSIKKAEVKKKTVVAKKSSEVSKTIKINKASIIGESTRVGKTTRKGKSEWISKTAGLEKATVVKNSDKSTKAIKLSSSNRVSVPKAVKTKDAGKTVKNETAELKSSKTKSTSKKTVAKKIIETNKDGQISRLNKTYKSEATIKPKKKKAKPKIKKKTYSLGGQITIKDNLEDDNPTLAVSASFKPDSSNYYYVKGGLKHSFNDDKEDLTYSWGVGYDDWHEGTWTVQVNHWGGIEKGEGLDIDNAFFSIGYKVKSDLLKKYKLKSAITLAKQIGSSGKPTLTTSLNYSPKQYWYVKGILSTPLDGSQNKWNYLFGFDDWHPGTFGFEYSNYAGSKLSETNFRKGDLAVFYKWKFK